MNKYFYFGLSVAAKTAALASAFIVAIGWNAKIIAYLIDSFPLGIAAGLVISMSAMLIAGLLPEIYRQKKVFLFRLSCTVVAFMIIGDGILSVEAINITDEAEKAEALQVENDPAVIAAKKRYDLAEAAHQRAQEILDPSSPANITNRNREREYAEQCWTDLQEVRAAKLAIAEMARPSRPLTNYVGALLLILAYSTLSIVADVPMARYRVLARKDQKAKKVTKVTKELQEDIVFQYKQLAPKNQETIRLFYMEAFAGEAADHELMRLRAAIRKDRIINNPNQNFSNWQRQVLSSKSGLNGTENSGDLAVSTNGKSNGANHI